MLTAILALLLLALFGAACTTPFDILRKRTEFLSETLYVRASWKDIWLSLIPRATYEQGAGYVKSSFQIGRSEPGTDEEQWNAIQPIDQTANGACNITYNQVYTGFHEDTYKPENFGLMGPLVCQDDLAMYYKSKDFWEKYFQALEKRNKRSLSNRIGNIYRQYSSKAACGTSFQYFAGDTATQTPPQAVDLSKLIAAPPTSDITQEFLDATATELNEEGADEPNTNGWITQGPHGPLYPLYIGQDASNRIFLNNSELRGDLNASYQGWADANPVLKRLGASGTLKNFRHVINRFPARWALMSNNQQIQYMSRSTSYATDSIQYATLTVAGTVGTVTVKNTVDNSTAFTYTLTAASNQAFVRIPTWCMSTNSLDATKGQVAVVNAAWRDAGIAQFESAEVLNPWVMTQEVLMPVQSAPGMKLNPQNYFGEWDFVTGNDALLGISSCTGVTDPRKKYGRHFGEARWAHKPIFALYGRLLLFQRCPSSFDTITCS